MGAIAGAMVADTAMRSGMKYADLKQTDNTKLAMGNEALSGQQNALNSKDQISANRSGVLNNAVNTAGKTAQNAQNNQLTATQGWQGATNTAVADDYHFQTDRLQANTGLAQQRQADMSRGLNLAGQNLNNDINENMQDHYQEQMAKDSRPLINDSFNNANHSTIQVGNVYGGASRSVMPRQGDSSASGQIGGYGMVQGSGDRSVRGGGGYGDMGGGMGGDMGGDMGGGYGHPDMGYGGMGGGMGDMGYGGGADDHQGGVNSAMGAMGAMGAGFMNHMGQGSSQGGAISPGEDSNNRLSITEGGENNAPPAHKDRALDDTLDVGAGAAAGAGLYANKDAVKKFFTGKGGEEPEIAEGETGFKTGTRTPTGTIEKNTKTLALENGREETNLLEGKGTGNLKNVVDSNKNNLMDEEIDHGIVNNIKKTEKVNKDRNPFEGTRTENHGYNQDGTELQTLSADAREKAEKEVADNIEKRPEGEFKETVENPKYKEVELQEFKKDLGGESELKDGEEKDGEEKDGELKDGELKDGELKDGELKDGEEELGEVGEAVGGFAARGGMIRGYAEGGMIDLPFSRARSLHRSSSSGGFHRNLGEDSVGLSGGMTAGEDDNFTLNLPFRSTWRG